MINYSRILQTGIQSLLAVACGWGCGRYQVVEPEPTVQYINTLVLRFCIPCLQVWLLAVKTDMQQPDNWRALAAFLVWSLCLQGLLALQQLLARHTLQLDKLAVDGLILTTNNTGILGPVVLEAAVGAKYAPLGMLATVVLYFQQLPLAQLLFELHRQQQHKQRYVSSRGSDAEQWLGQHGTSTPETHISAQNTADQSQLCGDAETQHRSSSSSNLPLKPLVPQQQQHNCDGHLQQPHHQRHKSGDQFYSYISKGATTTAAQGESGQHAAHLMHQQPDRALQTGRLAVKLQHGKAGSADRLQLQQHQQQDAHTRCSPVGFILHMQQQQQLPAHVLDIEQHPNGSTGTALAVAGMPLSSSAAMDLDEGQPLLRAAHVSSQPTGAAAFVLALLIKNPLVWSTGVAVLLSSMGSGMLLDPSSPLALKHLAFLEALLGWFAQTTAPLTLFTTGLWMYSNSVQLQQEHCTSWHQHHHRQQGHPNHHHQQQQQPHTVQHAELQQRGAEGLMSATTSNLCIESSRRLVVPAASGYGTTDLAWRDVLMHLLLRSTLAPIMMVLVCWFSGFQGDLAHALVILALLPVAQTAFVVCKQAEVGMAAISHMLVASLLVMLPQLMVVLALLEGLGVFGDSSG